MVKNLPVMWETWVGKIFPREDNGNPLQYSWVCLVAQLVKNSPAMQETPVRFLGQGDSLEKG